MFYRDARFQSSRLSALATGGAVGTGTPAQRLAGSTAQG